MDSTAIIASKIKKVLESKIPDLPEIDEVVDALVPSALTIFVSDHADLIRASQDELQQLSDAEIFANSKIQSALDDSIEKVITFFYDTYSQTNLSDAANSVVEKDIGTLLGNNVALWQKIKDKTYQEVLNLVKKNSNEEKIFFWLEEIRKNTGVSPNTNESVGNYSVRAIIEFLRTKVS
jgi:rRNA maturation endonuclease Nob1